MVAPRSFEDGPSSEAIDHVVQQYISLYIMALIGSLISRQITVNLCLLVLPLLRDLDEDDTLSWGSSVLVYLYHELCCATPSTSDQMDIPLILL